MRYDTLPQIEERFRSDATSALKPFSIPVPGEDLTLNGQLFKPNRSNYFYQTEYKKERIVLHFTAGNVRSDMITLTTQDRHVSVPFVIARDGTIYQLFPSKYWSGHLGAGVGNAGTKNAQDKATIGIEISNYGYLVPKGQTLETIYSRLKDPKTGKIGPVDAYCTLDQTTAYTRIDQPFRQQTHYAAYTPEQLDSLIILLRFLTAKYDIPRQFLPEGKRYGTTQDVLNFKGIVSHVNYRSSGKWDVGPAFDWASMIEGVQATSYIPIVSKEIGAKGIDKVLTSEQEIEALFPGSKDALKTEKEATDNEGYNPNEYDDKSILEVNSTSAKKKVFALLVGINEYQEVGKLSGCLNDVRAVKKYLVNSPDFDVQVEELTDQAATRKGIAAGFQNFLSQAGRNDTVLFYYSGHGTQEYADPLWDETDERLECLVCYDGGAASSADFLLTDKELRYLIHKIHKKTKAHIVTVFDCCHSGDNTRNAPMTKAVYGDEDRRERRVTSKDGGAFPQRKWNKFLFSDTIKKADIKNKKPAVFLPQGAHIQMAACESNQVALEVSGSGIFTKTLLKTLSACGGNVSYDALRSRVRQYMRAGFAQTPRVYMPIAAKRLLETGFLNRDVDADKMFCEATRNSKQGWQLNVGAIHGVDASSKVTLYDPKNPAKIYVAQVREKGVFVDYTLLDVKLQLDTDAVYKAEVAGLMTQELVLKMENHDGNLKEMKEFTELLLEKTSGGIVLGGEPKADVSEKDSGKARQPDYALHVRSGEMYLTRPGDPFRPLVRPMLYLKKKEKQKVIEMLQHVSRWHFIENLQNKDKPANFSAQPLKIELTQLLSDGTSQGIEISGDSAKIAYEEIDGNRKGTLQIKITNTTKQDLYVCAAYLAKEFQCFLDFLPQPVQLLEAGKSIALGLDGDDSVTLQLGKVEREYNWPGWQEVLKFIVSTTPFEAEGLTLPELPSPLTTADKGAKVANYRGGIATSSQSVQFSGWLTQTLYLVFENPLYNQIPGNVMKELSEWEETAYFAAGLYYDVEMKGFCEEPILTLKKGLVVPPDEKGILQSIGMKLGNVVETAQRRKRYRNLKDTGRTRIVAEGDSWFQYPIFLNDVLDQLYKVYAVRSFAEAGDTLENYLKKEEYIKAISDEKAKFFLVSGGGNDVLGEKFKTYLRTEADPGDTTPLRYLNQEFSRQLDILDGQYDQMFTELLDRYPELHILVHCYDYVIPVDMSVEANRKKSSWSGKHMAGKYVNGKYVKGKVEPQSEREKVVGYMVDEFAKRLTALVKNGKYKGRVSFVDTRGLVQKGSWSDEIHPKDEGFELVAGKFIDEIERVKTQNHWA